MRKPEVANLNSDGWGDRESLTHIQYIDLFGWLKAASLAPPPDSMFAHIPLQVESRMKREKPELTEKELLITSPILMGFSLSDKLWRKCCYCTAIPY